MQYLMALDIGTSAVKAALFDVGGRLVALDSQEYQLEKPRPDILEIDPEAYWTAVQAAVASIIAAAAVAAEDVVSIGVTSQGETLIVLDDAGRPLRKAIVWLDNRAVAEARQIAAAFDADEVYRRTGQHEIVPGWTAAKILWIRNHEAQLFKQAARFLMVEDYIIYRLTGEYVTDHAINPSTLYYDLTQSDWWDEMLAFLGISRSQLPQLRFSGRDGAALRASIGLSSNTTVVSTPMDQITGAVGAANVQPGSITETTGSALGICANASDPLYDPHKRVGLYRHALPGLYVVLPWVPTAGMILRWFRDELGGGAGFEQLCSEAANVPAGSDGLLVLPHFSGAVSPRVNPAARGVIYGLSLGHTRAHIVRAVMESVAFMLKENLDMLATLGLHGGRVCSLGGGARNDLWLQIKANVLDRTVVTPEAQESTCLGAAVLAAVGAGIYSGLDQAVQAMVRMRREFAPQPELVSCYADTYQDYLQLNGMLLPTFGGKQ